MPDTVAITIAADGTVRQIPFDTTTPYETVRGAVGGWIEGVQLFDLDARMYVDEEGKLKDLPVNAAATTLFVRQYGPVDIIVGDVIVVGLTDDDGNDTGLSHAQVDRIFAAVDAGHPRGLGWRS